LTASATFVTEVLSDDLFFPLFFLAAKFSRAASSNLLVPPTMAANNGVRPFEGCGGAPLAGGAWGPETAKGCGRDGWVWGGAILCDRSRRLDWIWLS